MTDFNLTFPISVVKKEQRIVSGIATADNIDKTNDVVDFAASVEAFKNWQGNIREMHAPVAVGKAISYKPIKIKGPDGKEYNAMQVEAYISKGAENTWQKVLDGTLRAFSIGGKIVKKEMMQGKVYNGRPISIIKEYNLGELSLVDNPANPLAVIDVVKFDSLTNSLDYVLDCNDPENACKDECVIKNLEKAKKPVLRDPKGGLTAAGRRHFKQKEGANLKPGVRGPANTPEKMRRKGSFLTRFFTNPSGPMKDDKGRPTRLALSAAAWGEPVPQDMQDAARLAAKGRRLLERYRRVKEKNKSIDDILNEDSEILIKDIEYFMSEQFDQDVLLMLISNEIEVENMSKKSCNKETCDCGCDTHNSKVLKSEHNIDFELQNDEKCDNVKHMDNSITDKMSLTKKFVNWLFIEPVEENGLTKSIQTEASIEAEVNNEQVEEEQMDIEVLKDALGTVIDQKLNDFATTLKAEIDADVTAKIEDVSKGFEVQKEELTQKLTATEEALAEQSAKVEEFAQAGAMKKSVDSEDDDVEELAKSAPAKSFWNNLYLPQGLINSLGYKS
jgi:hypothetical protein